MSTTPTLPKADEARKATKQSIESILESKKLLIISEIEAQVREGNHALNIEVSYVIEADITDWLTSHGYMVEATAMDTKRQRQGLQVRW